jgi:hypothetical protein
MPFEPNGPNSIKIRCTICGSSGYGPLDPKSENECFPWQQKCFRGHPEKCSCGRVFNGKSAIAAHLRHPTNAGHVKVTGLDNPDGVWQRWLTL